METKNLNDQAQHLINCNVNPFVPTAKSPAGSWCVVSHIKNGIIEWDSDKISLYFSEKQKNGLTGHDLLEELNSKPVLNANVLDYLLINPEIIPKEWEHHYIYFWGTIYHYSFGLEGEHCVRCLCVAGYPDKHPVWRFSKLSNKFFSPLETAVIFK